MNRMKKILNAFFGVLLFVVCINEAKEYLTTSVIIPCHPKHAKYLYELLKIYEKQTILPDEIVISISEVDQIQPHIIKTLQDEQWLFPVKLILSQKKLVAAQNRNIACAQATSEIFICQDADDIPHKQRIEVIKYFFEKFELDFLLHKFAFNNTENNEIEKIKMIQDFSSIDYTYIHTYHEAWIVGFMLFGQPAFRRHVFQKIKWPEIPIDEDNTFDNTILNTFKNCIMIHCTLYVWRSELSATPYELYRRYLKLKKGRYNEIYI